MFRTKFLCLLTILIVKSALCSETIPTYHWVYDYVDQLHVSGYLRDFYISTKPYTRDQIAAELVRLDSLIVQGEVVISKNDLVLVEKLIDEFRTEMYEIRSHDEQPGVKFGVWNDSQQSFGGGDESFDYYLKSIASLSVARNLTFYNSIKLDSRLEDNPDYVGRTWRNMTAFTEQAYARYRYKNFDFVLGRDFLKWGTGKTGNLLISDHSRPMDLAGFSVSLKFLKFSYFTARLDHWKTKKLGEASEYDAYMKRYLTTHRLDLKFSQKLFIGFTETLLYANTGEGLELQYLNPFVYYHGELLNKGGSDGNGFISVDVDYFPAVNWEIFGELMIDDIQIERTEPGDLEPTEYGLILGFQRSKVFGSLLGVEYVRVSNWTYNSGREWERFLHRNEPIGYSMGNDFDRWTLFLKSWVSENIYLNYGMEYRRTGEGRITDEWTSPWLERTLEQGYSEKFPTGVVEKTFRPWVNVRYHKAHNWWVEASLSYQSVQNYDHQKNKEESDFMFSLNFWVNLSTMISIPED
ncbi:hypothetical protein GF337_00400 [candidate division KSB1 bacterium]|nr:hypothetical protein [candidate division KSB1 bacterium]